MAKGAPSAGEKPRFEKPDVPPAVREASDVMEAAHEQRHALALQVERDHVMDDAEKNRTKSDEARALEALHRGYPA